MKKLFSVSSSVFDELKKIANSKSSKEVEKHLENLLEMISTHPFFLNSLSLVLNTQSLSKLMMNQTLEKIWKSLQLPNKKDQEKTLYLIHELQFKIHQLEKELKQQQLATQLKNTVKIKPLSSHESSDNSLNNIRPKKSASNVTNLV
ncbi:MAG: hypothetical protein HUU56_04980 [Bdellovibrionaceae bacterium]|nr:hypothetical protein [Pseudobdellovibrionaceae bacterium]